MTNVEDRIAPGRSCGACTLCCKVFAILELEKPQGKWCEHCTIGIGCKIHGEHPEECKKFMCGYLIDGLLSDDWLPTKSKIILVTELNGRRLAAHVDQSRPDAWRAEPYYSRLKAWARLAAPKMDQVVVFIGQRAIVILPDADVDLGIIGEDEMIVTQKRNTVSGQSFAALKIKRDDPRVRSTRQ